MSRTPPRILALCVACALISASAGCARARHTAAPDESTTSVVPDGMVVVERAPSGTPKQAVTAYLAAIPEAYFSLEVTVVAPFVTERQEVREDSYIQLNRQDGTALEMKLVSFQILEAEDPAREASSTIVRTREQWRWRYWDLRSRKPSTEWAATMYEMEYTVEREGAGWLVAGSKIVSQSGDATPTPLP